MDIQYKNFPFEIKEIKESKSQEFGIIKGYASTFENTDRGNDRVVMGAFRETIRKYLERNKQIPMLYQHESDNLIGGFDVFREDDKGLYVEGKINLGVQKGKETYLLAKQGVLSDFSIGYYATDYEYVKQNNETIRLLNKVDLVEVSMVINPMNEQANIIDVKRATRFLDLPLATEDREWDSTAAMSRVRNFTDSNDMPSSRYKDAFLWYDQENEENFTAYKLPYADVINGELKAVPRAIFAVAAALSGARGGVDIPASDRNAIIRHLERYYAKMDRESPFQSSSSYESITDISRKLKEKGFSNKEANEIIYFIKSLTRNDESDESNDKSRNDSLSKFQELEIDLKLRNLIKQLKEKEHVSRN